MGTGYFSRGKSSLSPFSWRPQLALLVEKAPTGDDWLHELKYDGYRIGAERSGRTVRLWTRKLNDWTKTFPEIADDVRALTAKSAFLDGEVAIETADGRTSFQALQNAIALRPPRKGLVFFAFDLLELNGENLTALPIEERKARLQQLLSR